VGHVKKAWAKIERSCGEANLTLHKNFLNSPDCQMAENLHPPWIAGRHFFVDIKTVHFGRNGTSNSTTEAATVRSGSAQKFVWDCMVNFQKSGCN
jgi:hypothetical protein